MENIQPNKSSALIALGIMRMTEGEIYKIQYINSFGQIDCLVALGIGDGVGPDYYTIISDGSEFLVNKIVTSLPDISDAVFGSVFLLTTEDGLWRCHISPDHVWAKEKIEGDHIVTCSEDGGKYFIASGNITTGFSSDNLSFQLVTDKAIYTIPINMYPTREELEIEDDGEDEGGSEDEGDSGNSSEYYYGGGSSGFNMIGVWDE